MKSGPLVWLGGGKSSSGELTCWPMYAGGGALRIGVFGGARSSYFLVLEAASCGVGSSRWSSMILPGVWRVLSCLFENVCKRDRTFRRYIVESRRWTDWLTFASTLVVAWHDVWGRA